jgi:hypothetical protein
MKKGFTLTKTLITLGVLVIIFVVAGFFIFDESNEKTPEEIIATAIQDQKREKEDNDRRMRQFEQEETIPIVWAQIYPGGESYEFKVNCTGEFTTLEECFLWDLDAVQVVSQNGNTYNLNKDFNIQEYSGEITRRWVLYGEPGGGLPQDGTHQFNYIKDGKVIRSQQANFKKSNVSFPTNVKWQKKGNDFYVEWEPPTNVDSSMWYKPLIWNTPGTPEILVSNVIEWDAQSATLKDVPLVKDGEYSLSVAVYYEDGYSYSEYVIFNWPG